MPSVGLLSLAVSALVASTASAASCDLTTLVPLLVDERNDACQAASGIAFPPRRDAAPTAAQWQKTCGVEACTTLLEDLLTATPSECSIGSYAAHADLVDQYRGACGLPLSGGSTGSLQNATASSASGSLDREVITSQDLITAEPTTPEPTTEQPKRNKTMVVEALTNGASAPTTVSALALAVSAVVATVATFAL